MKRGSRQVTCTTRTATSAYYHVTFLTLDIDFIFQTDCVINVFKVLILGSLYLLYKYFIDVSSSSRALMVE